MITCSVVQKAYGFNDCCSSCHEDADEGFEDLAGDGVNFSVCCNVQKFLQDRHIDVYSEVTDAGILAAARDLDEEALNGQNFRY